MMIIYFLDFFLFSENWIFLGGHMSKMEKLKSFF